jgi:hypothetical protein
MASDSKVLRCAIYTRKSTEHGLELEFNSLDHIASNAIMLPAGDKKILAEFKKDHLAYLNLGAHGNVIPNETRLAAARDSIDQFVKKYV